MIYPSASGSGPVVTFGGPPSSGAMKNRVLHQGLQYQWRDRGFVDIRIQMKRDLQVIAKAEGFELEIVLGGLELIRERDHPFRRGAQRVAQQLGEPFHHFLGNPGLFCDQAGQRVE